LVRRFEDGGADAALVLVTFTDLSDRKAIETAAGSLPLEMIGLDRDLRITWINTHALAGIGRPANALLGRHWFDVFPDLAPRLTIYQRVLAGESLDFDQVSPTLAWVKPQLQMFGGVMQDYLNIVFLDGQWWVMAKMWEKVGEAA
jgi:PAS domain-containing protein